MSKTEPTTNPPSETELLACKTCGHHANRHGHIIGDNSGACFVPSEPGGHLCPCNEFINGRPIPPPNASLTTRAAAFLTKHWGGKEPTTTLLAETMAAFVEEETAVAPVDEVGDIVERAEHFAKYECRSPVFEVDIVYGQQVNRDWLAQKLAAFAQQETAQLQSTLATAVSDGAEMRAEIERLDDLVGNLSMLVRCFLASKFTADSSLKTRAGDYLMRKGLQGSILRDDQAIKAEVGKV